LSPGLEPGSVEARVFAALAALGGSAAIGELEVATREGRHRLRAALAELGRGGWVRRTGDRGSTRYHLAEAPSEETP